jgi:hypothetical protein
MLTDGTKQTVAPNLDDVQLGKGQAWGDFMFTGTAGIVKLDVDFFDKKPLMDCIGAIRDIVGFDFHIDETGGVVWRLPNVFHKGNYLMPTTGGPRTTRTEEIVQIGERQTLIDMQAKISSRNVRERVFIGNLTGHKAAVVKGFNPAPSGQRRVGGWTDQHFASNAECQRMAELIALRQSFLYRQNTLTIPGNPQIQIDDQVRIFERMTGEGYLHRVLSIQSNFDNEEGAWTYQLNTHWLGEDAFTKWAFDPEYLSKATQHWLHELGVYDGKPGGKERT